jgi:diphosphomevalonate decarboxylase
MVLVKVVLLLQCSLQHQGPVRSLPETGAFVQDGMQAEAQAQPNIALVKYWGKRDIGLNLPAVGSISITLADLSTRTRVTLDPALRADTFLLDGAPARPGQTARVCALLDRLRARAGSRLCARVESANDFPTGAGLASSASGFAALVVAAARAYGLELDPRERSVLARLGSGSAARSIFGGYVEMARGTAPDGADACAHALREAAEWPLEVVIAVTSTREKAVGSTEGMARTAETSPYYEAWVRTSEDDLAAARSAIAARDFDALADVSVHSCLKMHALALAARPGILYWNGATVAALHAIDALRRAGAGVFYTVDAGPQVKAVCVPADAEAVTAALRAVPGVERVLRTGLGAGARLVAVEPHRLLA